jgi:hypothetical protein
VDIGPRGHGRQHDLDLEGLADAGGVVVDEVALEVLDLVVVQGHLGELTDAGVDPVHGLAGRNPLLDEAAALLDPGQGVCGQRDLLAVSGDGNHVVSGEILAGEGDGHGGTSCVSARATILIDARAVSG